MNNDDSAPMYRVWGIDNIAYGPVELPMLVAWIRQQRVGPEDWIFRDDLREWKRGKEYPELEALLKGSGTQVIAPDLLEVVKPAELRRIKIFSDLTESQIRSLLGYLEIISVPAHRTVFTQGEHGDTMFLVLEGEVRARVLLQGQETTLGTFYAGECFGEVAVLDQGPRSADVITNSDCILLKISEGALKTVFREAPALVAPLLMNLGRTVVTRLRNINKRYQDSVQFMRATVN